MSPGKSGKKGLRSGGSMWQRVALGPRLTIGHRYSRWRYCPKFASAAVGKVCEALPSLTDSHLRLTVAGTKSLAATSWLGQFRPCCICRSLAHPNGPLRPFKLVMQWPGSDWLRMIEVARRRSAHSQIGDVQVARTTSGCSSCNWAAPVRRRAWLKAPARPARSEA